MKLVFFYQMFIRKWFELYGTQEITSQDLSVIKRAANLVGWFAPPNDVQTVLRRYQDSPVDGMVARHHSGGRSFRWYLTKYDNL